ncbi:SRB5 [Candida theae]|uniref:Mediator of RNA polymerase II transcription subunit 18 n=1 Tax=Candida theae TaxID=1198502 RepID=A0AAD5B919_9ASCO|nr:SRB5 [Candida theae]KAI5948720.1 SRB5 [Candida theae]
MVQQLSLVSSIPHSNYLQTITSLQAITGILQPQKISTYSLITKPNHVFKPIFEPGKINQIEQYYMRCSTTWEEPLKSQGGSSSQLDIAKPIFKDDKENPILVKKLFHNDDNNNTITADDGVDRVWTLQISDIPIAGKNQTCSQQTIYESTLVHTHVGVDNEPASDLDDKMDVDADVKEEKEGNVGTEAIEVKKVEDMTASKSDDATIKKEDGAETDVNMEDSSTKDAIKDVDTDKGASIEVTTTIKTEPKEASTRTKSTPSRKTQTDSFLIFLNDLGYEVVNQYWVKGVRFFYKDIVIEIYKIFIRDDDYEGKDDDAIKLKLLDESNTFQVKCFVNVPKTTDVELINAGAKELTKLQEFVKSLFLLEVPDRMSMDSRVRSLK